MGTFYLYFRSKREIFRELVRDLGHRLRSEIARAVAGLSTRREVEQEGFRRFFEFTRRHPGLYRIVRQAEFFDPPSFVAYYRRLAEGYARGLERAMRSGEIRREDPELLAYALMGIGDMVGMRWILQRRPGAVPPRVLDALIRFAFEGMGSREEDQRRRPEATAGRGASSGGLGRPRQRARSSRTRSAAASK
jgi:AcrR family transcriptional regulator